MQYIRFFISSTFSDMGRERDILNKVLTDLRAEFSGKGWMIEWIDLRWGISQEASLDNQTMRICLKELNRCRQLSPRPNFIILAGERYGWIPLPEIIPSADIDIAAVEGLAEEDLTLFREWYRPDSNALPSGEYLLQPRRGEFADNDVYEAVSGSYILILMDWRMPAIVCRYSETMMIIVTGITIPKSGPVCSIGCIILCQVLSPNVPSNYRRLRMAAICRWLPDLKMIWSGEVRCWIC